MKARLAKKILKAKTDYKQFERYDFPYTGEQLLKAYRRTGVTLDLIQKLHPERWRKVSKKLGKFQTREIFKRV